MEHARIVQRQPDGHSLDGNRAGPRVGDLVRLLDDGFSRRAARARGEGSAIRQDGADHRSGFQDDGAVHRHSAGPARAWRCCRRNLSARRRRLLRAAHSYNEVLPLMLARYCGPGLLGLGITALIAGFMSGMAGNVSAFATVWTYDIYRALIRQGCERTRITSRWAAGARSWVCWSASVRRIS